MGGITIPEVIQDFIINIINIIVLFVIVRALIYKPVRKFLAARTEKIEAKERQADETAKKAEQTAADYEKLVAESDSKGDEIVREAERTAKQNAQKIEDAAREEARAIVDKARSDMRAEHAVMIASAQEEITALAIGISSRILQRELTDADNAKIAADFFSEQNEKANALLNRSVAHMDEN